MGVLVLKVRFKSATWSKETKAKQNRKLGGLCWNITASCCFTHHHISQHQPCSKNSVWTFGKYKKVKFTFWKEKIGLEYQKVISFSLETKKTPSSYRQ